MLPTLRRIHRLALLLLLTTTTTALAAEAALHPFINNSKRMKE
jgi:hypothetical protein